MTTADPSETQGGGCGGRRFVRWGAQSIRKIFIQDFGSCCDDCVRGGRGLGKTGLGPGIFAKIRCRRRALTDSGTY